MLSDTQKVDDDVTRIQQYAADHPNESASDALMDPAYQADVAAFKKDVMQMNKDAKNYNFNPKYRGDGMDESNDCVNMILNTTIDWRPDGNNQSIVSMIDNNQDGSLGAALFYAAKQPTDSGTFHSWTDGSGAAGAVSLSIVESDYGNFTSNLNQQLNVAGANLQQDNQVGQNFITSMNSMINLIVQHLAPGG
ncbi:MAG: hypothetical protein HYX48_03470 [Chlamydiales bacterium]|nr:hypothetical protein [Chlamydiales bacterium]